MIDIFWKICQLTKGFHLVKKKTESWKSIVFLSLSSKGLNNLKKNPWSLKFYYRASIKENNDGWKAELVWKRMKWSARQMFWRGGLCYFEMVGAALLFIPSHSQNEIIERNLLMQILKPYLSRITLITNAFLCVM